MSSTKIHEKMFAEMQSKKIFKEAQEYGYDYINKAFTRNVYPTEQALDNLSIFEENLSVNSSNASEIIKLLHQYGSPATVSQIGGRYFGFVNGSVVPAGLAAKNLAIFWDQNTAMQVISPISSKLETVVEKWLIELFDLPKRTIAGFVSGTSAATFAGLAAARYRILKRLNWDVNEDGLFNAPKIRIVVGKQAHSTVLKAISLLGFGKNNIEWVNVDEQGSMILKDIPELDSTTILILQAGNVNSGAFDNFEKICTLAQQKNAWVHIDGAFGLWAAASKKLNYLTNGINLANSWAVDGHKTLNTPYDSGIILCEDKEAIVSALHITGSYIILGEERDGMFYTPEMSRRSRIVELWATMKYLGKSGIDEMIIGLHDRATKFAEEISEIEGYKVENDVVFNQILVSCKNDKTTEETIQKIQEDRACWVGGATWKGKKVIRVSVCSWATTKKDIKVLIESFKKALNKISNK